MYRVSFTTTITTPPLHHHFTNTTSSTLPAKRINVNKLKESSAKIYRRGRHVSYQRGKRNTNPNTSLIKIEGVAETKAAT